MLCVIDSRLSDKQHRISCFSQGSAATLFRRGGRIYNFSDVKFPQDSVHQKSLKIG